MYIHMIHIFLGGLQNMRKINKLKFNAHHKIGILLTGPWEKQKNTFQDIVLKYDLMLDCKSITTDNKWANENPADDTLIQHHIMPQCH